MDFDGILQAISSVGFPIFAAVYMMYQQTKVAEALNRVTLAITEMTTYIKKDGNEQ